ncbi:MAG TPA: methylated-DNA--[protein]-cysteine S-methyltransferase [Mycobacteriales bacterium]|jgi:methylated-DNA-[protein]-cysteine S-methyltransferase
MTWTVLDPTPVGPLLLVADGEALTTLHFGAGPGPGERDDDDPVLVAVATQLREYFAGDRKEFDLPLAPRGTDFQRAVWERLREIPYGTTITYGELARRVGNPAASRAVGLANGRNPIAIVVPCHRVIGSDGKLTGFAGGMDTKRALLELESATLF